MQPVFGFIPDNRLRPIYYRCSYFFTAVRGQAMHEDGVWLRLRHHTVIDLIGAQQIMPGLRFRIVHGHPGVSDDTISAINGLIRIRRQIDAPAFRFRPGRRRSTRLRHRQ